MPAFAMTARSPAPVEEVWKLLHDPTRFPEWWDGMATVVPGRDGAYTMWPVGCPDHPMAQRVEAGGADGRVTISCLVSDLVFVWRLRAAGEETDVDVEVELPEHEAHRLADQRGSIERSLRSLVALAVDGQVPDRPVR